VSGTTPSAVLLTPLPAEAWGEEVQRALSPMLPAFRRNPDGAGNALATLVRHPALTRAFLGLNVHLLFNSTLPERLRELAILRLAVRCDAAYEWHHHVEMGKQVGLTDAEIDGIRNGTAADEFDRTVLTAVDELEDAHAISPETWAALGAQLDDQQRMDLIFTIGTYRTLAVAFNTFGIQLDNPTAYETR